MIQKQNSVRFSKLEGILLDISDELFFTARQLIWWLWIKVYLGPIRWIYDMLYSVIHLLNGCNQPILLVRSQQNCDGIVSTY